MSEHHKILSLKVNSGFLQGVRLDFSDELNCIIGGRGTGKTTVLELIRFVLDRMPSQSVDKSRHQHLQQLIKHNLGQGTAEVKVRTKDGATYIITRAFGEQPIITDENGKTANFDISKDTVFGVEVYSQSEIENIANNPLFQLTLIDKFADRGLNDVKAGIRETTENLKQNGRLLTEISQRAEALRDKLHELPDLKERLRILSSASGDKSSPVEDAHRQHAARLREREAIEGLILAHRGGKTQTEKFLSTLEPSISMAHLPRQSGSPDVVQSAFRISKQSLSRTEESLTTIIDDLTNTEVMLTEKKSELVTLQAEPDRVYQELIARHERDREQGAERARIEHRLVELARVETEVEAVIVRQTSLTAERASLRIALSELRDQRYAHRSGAAKYLNDQLHPAIMVSIKQGGGTDEYHRMVGRVMKGVGIHYKAILSHIVDRIPPPELARIAHENDSETLARDLDIDIDRANKIIGQLASDPEIYAIEIVELHDTPSIKLMDGEYKDSARLSTGQKCTVILPILLLKNERVLLVDQPEDNLDNAFIFKTVVKALRGIQGARQLLFITHNPNIPVLGDASRVFCLHSTGKAATVAGTGNVDEVAPQLIAILEGGRAAFEARRVRYGSASPEDMNDE